MFTDFLLNRISANPERISVIWGEKLLTSREIVERVGHWRQKLNQDGIPPGAVVGLEADFSPNGIGLLLALIGHACIIVPQSNSSHVGRGRKDEIAQVEYYYRIAENDSVTFEKTGQTANHELYSVIRSRQHPGLLLFSSGTSGDPKAALHDFVPLLEKFKISRVAFTTLNFLLFDHWGGLNTLFHCLSNSGTTITVRDRSPENICRLIERHKISLLPATPTFLNLLLLRGAYKDFDLSSLEIISYGAEPMTQGTLDRLTQIFPNVKLQQTYGLIEVGVLRSKSKENGSLWVKVGGEGYQTRVVDGMLQIKTASTILGYLNAPSPITPDGWFMTGDAVEVEGDYLKILGRKSELINVGGEKVYPTEVENVILQMPNVLEVTVFGESNPLFGKIVCARVRLNQPQPVAEFSNQLKLFCQSRLDRFKIPVKVTIDEHVQYGDRFKKQRSQQAGESINPKNDAKK